MSLLKDWILIVLSFLKEIVFRTGAGLEKFALKFKLLVK
jgi:hypothetical protein